MVTLFPLFVFLASANHDLLNAGYKVAKHHLGGKIYSKFIHETHKHHEVEMPTHEEMNLEYLQRLIAKDSTKVNDQKYLSCDWGEGPDYFRFAPQYKAQIYKDKGSVTFSNHCFQRNTAEIVSYTDNSVTIKIDSEFPSSLTCYDNYFLSTLSIIQLENQFLHGTYTYTFNNITASDMTNINNEGIRIFTFCDGFEDLVTDLLMTLKMFLGGFSTDPDRPIIGSHTPQYMIDANRQFLIESIGYDMKPRTVHRTNISKEDIKTGDFLAITRLDGLDPIIMYGSGSRVGHSTMAFWKDGELYVMESQAGWYWPRTGIQINPYDTWIQWADNASFNIALLPLKDEVRAKFNDTAVYEWFKTVEGMPYGFHNFLFGWIDTPDQNFPDILHPSLFEVAFRLVEEIAPSVVDNFFNEAMNKHLGTTGLNIPELSAEAYRRGMTFNDILAVVEEDGWMYSDGYSYVCSSFVLGAYKAAGILGDLKLQATEFTPRDVIMLNIFDKNPVRPQGCIDADPDLPYCMLIGDYVVDVGEEYGTIEPYDHMNERCPSIAPYFKRPDGC